MNTAVKTPPTLSESEWELILELIERERADLPAEIHHTRTTAMRQVLRDRLETIDRLLERLREPPHTD